MTVAERIVEDIIKDLSDRNGIGSDWDSLQDGVKKEIRKTWEAMVERTLAGPLAAAAWYKPLKETKE